MTIKHDITCGEFKSMAGAYALGALDAGDRMACSHHLTRPTSHQGCFEAAAQAQRVTSMLAMELPPQPPTVDLWKLIEARVTRAAPRVKEGRARPSARSTRARPGSASAGRP